MNDTKNLRIEAGYALKRGLYVTYKAMIEAADTIDTLRAENERLEADVKEMREALIDATVHLIGAASAYEEICQAFRGSQCGQQQGFGTEGYSHCADHQADSAELAARNAAVIWLYQRAAEQACINARFPKHVACYPEWVKSQQTMASLAQELETSPIAWAEFDKWCRGGGHE